MSSSKTNRFFSTLNAVLVFGGYQFVAVLFGNIFSSLGSQTITIAYRLFAFVVCMIVIVLNIRSRNNIDRPIKVLLLFWVLAIGRFLYDMYIRTDVYVPDDYIYTTGLFMVVINFIPLISLVLSFNNINLDKTLLYVYLFLSVATIISFFSNESLQITDEYSRNTTAGLGAIGTGHLGLSTLVLSVYLIVNNKKKLLKKLLRSILYIGIAIISLLVMLRSGSRGPILSLIFVLGFYLAGKSKYPIVFIVILVVLYLLSDYLITGFLELLDSVAPNLSRRFSFHEDEGQFMGRMQLYKFAWEAFTKSPVLGKYFAIYTNHLLYEVVIYPHNLFLDALMQLGIIGFCMITYVVVKTCKVVLKLVKYRISAAWIGLIYIQFFSELQVSSAYYLTPVFSLSTIILLLLSNNVLNAQIPGRYVNDAE